MNCDRARELLALGAGDDLTGVESAALDLHVYGDQGCADCQQFHERLECNQSLLRSLRREMVPAAALTRMRRGLFLQLEDSKAALGWRIRMERFLLTGFRRPRYAVAGVAIAAVFSFAFFPQMGRVAADPFAAAAVYGDEYALRRPDYTDWKVVGATAHSEHRGFEKTYIDPAAYREFVRTGKFPEGTMMVLESAAPSTSLLASVKDSKRFKSGWGYFKFNGSDEARPQILPESAGCIGCHRDQAGTDHVFTQFYPVLRTAAGVL